MKELNEIITVYTISIDNKLEIVGEFKDIDIQFRFEPQDEVPTELPEETQLCFTLKDGWLKLKKEELNKDQLVIRKPNYNITLAVITPNYKEGRLDIVRCLFDISTINSNNVEGVAEKMLFLPETIEEFKSKFN